MKSELTAKQMRKMYSGKPVRQKSIEQNNESQIRQMGRTVIVEQDGNKVQVVPWTEYQRLLKENAKMKNDISALIREVRDLQKRTGLIGRSLIQMDSELREKVDKL